MNLLVGRKFRSVEFLVEVGETVVGHAIQTAADLAEQAVLGQLAAANTGVLGGRTTEFVNRLRGEIPMLTDEFQNSIVGRDHPLSALAHIFRLCDHSHTSTVVLARATYELSATTELKSHATNYVAKYKVLASIRY